MKTVLLRLIVFQLSAVSSASIALSVENVSTSPSDCEYAEWPAQNIFSRNFDGITELLGNYGN